MARSPHERTRHILGVDETIIVRRLNGNNARLRSDSVDTNIVVIGRNNTRDMRAVIELVTPPVKILSRNTIDRTLHGTRRINAPFQIRMSVLNARINDGDGHRGTLDVHGLGLARMHSDRTPVENLLVCTSGGGARTLLTHGGQPACRAGLRGLVLLVCGQLDALVVQDGGHTGGSNRVNRDACLPHGCGQVGRERGRGALREESPNLGVRGQGSTARSGDEGEGSVEVLGIGAREVDRVVHLVIVGAGCRDEAGLLGSRGGGVHRSHAHGQGEGSDETDACGDAAHVSSTFVCHCQDFGCIGSCTHHPRVCQ